MEVTGNFKNIYLELLKLIKAGQPCAIAMVTASAGSTPQVPGSSAIISKSGLITGTVGGGTVEFQVVRKAQEMINSGKSGLFSFNLNNDVSKQEEAICGGEMEVLIDFSPGKDTDIFRQIETSLKNRQSGILITVTAINGRSETQISRYWYKGDNQSLPSEIQAMARVMLENCRAGEFREIRLESDQSHEKTVTFLETVSPPPRLIIAGAGHIGKAVAHLGKLLDFEVTVWDDRSEYANHYAIPEADHIVTGPFSDARENLRITPDTYLIIVTRGHKHDAEVLKEYIQSDAAYIGMIGSRNKIGQVRDQFLLNGWATPEHWEKIHSPVGLSIGAKTVNEIAISIAAQLVQVKNYKMTGHG